MSATQVSIVLTFTHEDQAWIRRNDVRVPRFWDGHATQPLCGDVLRIGGRQFEITARVWENDAQGPVLRLYLGSGHADSDTNFQSLA